MTEEGSEAQAYTTVESDLLEVVDCIYKEGNVTDDQLQRVKDAYLDHARRIGNFIYDSLYEDADLSSAVETILSSQPAPSEPDQPPARSDSEIGDLQKKVCSKNMEAMLHFLLKIFGSSHLTR